MGAVISLVFFKLLPQHALGDQLALPELRTSSSGRLALWSHTLLESRLFGNGGGSFACDGFLFGHPHSSLLGVLYQWGVLPSAIYVTLAFLLLHKVCTTPYRLSRVLGVNLLTGMLYSLLSGVFVMPLSQLFAVMSLAVFWSSIKPDLIQKRRVAGWSHALLTLFAASILISTSYIGYKRVEFYQSQIVAEDLVFENVAIQLWIGNNCLR